LTNAVGTDPIGGGNASSFRESASTTTHAIGQPISTGVSMTCSFYVHAGTSGTRNVEIIVGDASFANNAWADFTQAGVNTGSGGTGSSVSGITSTSVGGGWSRVGATVNLNTPIAFFFLFLDNGSNAYNPTYTGDNTSNVWLWGPTCQ